LVGLLQPTSGEILLDGIPLNTIGPRVYREQIGVVMQDDQLLSGSIAENICFFAHSIDDEWMRECATMAAIHADIMNMPMGYNTLIGDMGSSLSGGQKQRILLARALYRRPKILFLDEATAHIDSLQEKQISESLQMLPLTRIIIAHRSGSRKGADRRVQLEPRRGVELVAA
jgi:ATP-binding cassette subfamily B protein RaxB